MSYLARGHAGGETERRRHPNPRGRADSARGIFPLFLPFRASSPLLLTFPSSFCLRFPPSYIFQTHATRTQRGDVSKVKLCALSTFYRAIRLSRARSEKIIKTIPLLYCSANFSSRERGSGETACVCVGFINNLRQSARKLR